MEIRGKISFYVAIPSLTEMYRRICKNVWEGTKKVVSLQKEKGYMERPVSYQEIIEQDYHSDIVAEPQYEMFFNNGDNERREEGTLRVLSLFSGCGGMDRRLEGGFICHNHSISPRIGYSVKDAKTGPCYECF